MLSCEGVWSLVIELFKLELDDHLGGCSKRDFCIMCVCVCVCVCVYGIVVKRNGEALTVPSNYEIVDLCCYLRE